MSGHSKFSNRKHRKAKQDAIRAKIFTKLSKEIIIAVKAGGPDADSNLRLRMAIDAAKENNMPNDNISRAVAKGSGDLDGVTYDEFYYEGYGPSGVAVLVEIATDNRNRTAADIRYLFSRNGGSLGQNGCVAWMFERKGVIRIDREENAYDEEELLMAVLEAGGDDLLTEDDVFEIYTQPDSFISVKEALIGMGYAVSESGIEQVAKNTVGVSGDAAEEVIKLIEALEDNDDVQKVFSNFDIE